MTGATLIGTVAGVGYLKPAPGTWGALAALPLAWGIAVLTGPLGLLQATVIAYAAGIWATRAMTAGSANHDPSEIVVDEVAGQWVALMPVVSGAWLTGNPLLALWPGWVTAFVLFRLFDITKWGPVGYFDRRNDAVGVMADDIAAGILAAMGVIIIAAIAHLGMRLA